MPKDILAFSEEDFKTLTQPHNDALVISFLLNNVQIKRVLVDPGSSANVIRSNVVEQLKLLDQIMPTSRVLNDFNMAGEATKWVITLPINISEPVQDTKFHIIDGDIRYKAFLGRPWIYSMRAVPSTLHQMMKFPTKDGKKRYTENSMQQKKCSRSTGKRQILYTLPQKSRETNIPLKMKKKISSLPEPSFPPESRMQQSRLLKN
uniref:Uncharacterized protein n=1 Tax=Nicotiana tabacum TaxID=4097 RepID=A0A1S4AM64_TOBAC|nr:PREDICTED: uncharacterized protein LOC107799137 [Nicotiana tabacum]